MSCCCFGASSVKKETGPSYISTEIDGEGLLVTYFHIPWPSTVQEILCNFIIIYLW